MNKEFYVLYIVKINKRRAIKIGITSGDRYLKRFQEIEKAFGKININESFIYTSESMKDIKNLEKSLHLLYWKSSKELKVKGSGYTEFFKDSIYKSLIFLLKNLTKNEYKTLSKPIYLKDINKGKNYLYLYLYLLIIPFFSFFIYKSFF